jgi:hypothetical protein
MGAFFPLNFPMVLRKSGSGGDWLNQARITFLFGQRALPLRPVLAMTRGSAAGFGDSRALSSEDRAHGIGRFTGTPQSVALRVVGMTAVPRGTIRCGAEEAHDPSDPSPAALEEVAYCFDPIVPTTQVPYGVVFSIEITAIHA